MRGDIVMGSEVYWTCRNGTEGVHSPCTEYHILGGNHWSDDQILLISDRQLLHNTRKNARPSVWTCWKKAETCSSRNLWRAKSRPCGNAQRGIRMWRTVAGFTEAVSQCFNFTSQNNANCSTGPERQEPDISTLYGHCRVRLNTVGMLDYSTPDGHSTQTQQLPNRQSKMGYPFNHLIEIALGQILPHVWKDGTIKQGDLPAWIQLLKAAFQNTNWAATVESIICKTHRRYEGSFNSILGLKVSLLTLIGTLQLLRTLR